MVVIFKACVEHGVLFGLSHAIEFAFVVVAKTDVFHCSSPHSGLAEPAAERGPRRARCWRGGVGERCAGSFISSLRRVFRDRSGQVVYLLPPGPCSGAG